MSTTLQLFGGPLAGAIDLDLERSFSVVSRLLGVSPLSVCAPPDPAMSSYADPKQSTPRSRLDTLKNLSAELERADADYFVLDLTSAAMELATVGTTWFSVESGEKSKLMEDLIRDPKLEPSVSKPYEMKRLSRELRDSHDSFIECVRAHYAADRIILITSHVSNFFWDGRAVRPRAKSRSVRHLRSFLRELEERFELQTGCRTIDVAQDFLPLTDAALPDLRLGRDFQYALERELVASCTGSAPRSAAVGRSRRASDDFVEWAHEAALSNDAPKTSKLLRRLHARAGFSVADVHAVAALAARFPELDQADIAADMVAAQSAEPVLRTRQRFETNRELLSGYEYCFVSGVVETGFASSIVLPICDQWFLTVGPGGTSPIRIEARGRTQDWDPEQFAAQGYRCSVREIDNALESWWAYFQKGRTGDTSPFLLEFADAAELVDSMHYLDYPDVLSNERYCLVLRGQTPPRGLVWEPRVDTAFLFDPRTRVCCLRSGLGDQLFYYVYARYFTDRAGLRLYIDDLLYDNDDMVWGTPHIRPDVLPMTKSDGVFSQIFSDRLRRARRRDIRNRRDNRSEFHQLGLREMVLATDRMHLKCCLDRRDIPTSLTVQVTDLEGYETLTLNPPGILFLDVLAKEGLLRYRLLEKKELWESAFEMADFVSEGSRQIADQMLATDAIVVHIRRGDRVTLGMADGDAYYRDFVVRTAALEEYQNKHWYVFSDDLEYCRSHRVELGLDVAGDRITFVEGNNHFASIDDFHLMELGKVVICGKSGFSACAAMISRRVEYIFGTGYSLAPGGDSWSRREAAST